MSDWRAELGTFLTDHNRKSRAEKDAARFKEFLSVTALPALQEIGNELKKYGRMATIRQTEAAARAAGRDPAEILLCAASKMNDAQRVQEAVAAGVDCCGENRVQELVQKQPLGA